MEPFPVLERVGEVQPDGVRGCRWETFEVRIGPRVHPDSQEPGFWRNALGPFVDSDLEPDVKRRVVTSFHRENLAVVMKMLDGGR